MTLHGPATSRQNKPASRSGRDEGRDNHPVKGLPGWITVDGTDLTSVGLMAVTLGRRDAACRVDLPKDYYIHTTT